MKERWKPVQGFEGYYQVSDQGRVRSVPRKACKHCGYRGKPEQYLKLSQSPKFPYALVNMSKPGMGARKSVSITLHRLVALHFVKGRTPERNIVNHKDCDKTNSKATNLEWVTYSENSKHAVANGRWPIYKRHNRWTKDTPRIAA